MKLKKLMCTTAVLAGLMTFSSVHADETGQAQLNQDTLTKLSAEKTTLQSNINATQQKLDNFNKDKNTFNPSKTLINQETPDQLKTKLQSFQAQLTMVDSKINSINKQEAERQAAEQAQKEAQAKQAKEDAINRGETVTGSVTATPVYDGDAYPTGQCTWGAKALAPWAGNNWGNAGSWVQSAQAAGFRTGRKPVPGALIVWVGTSAGYGHVAFVTDVESENKIQIQEANYGGSAWQADPRGIGNYRGWFNPAESGGDVYYIYPNP